MSSRNPAEGNFISEWFGHRVLAGVVSSQKSIEEHRAERCPFLSLARGRSDSCVKPESSKGVCTISSVSNGQRQDWVVCPYRAFDKDLMEDVARRLFELSPQNAVHIYAAPLLSEKANQERVLSQLDLGESVLIYFDHKLGGEVQLSPTAKSPQMAFDTTFVTLVRSVGRLSLGRFALMEIQT